MFRKWMTILLALMMMVTMPLSALADKQHTLSIIPGDVLASEEVVADLLDALDLRLTEGDRSSALTVLLNDQEIVTLGLAADASGLYADSKLFGEEVLYITWDDAFALLSAVMQMSMEEAGVNDEETMQVLETSMTEAKNSLIAAFEAEEVIETQTFAPVSYEESAAMVAEVFGDDPEMTAFVEGLYEDIIIEEGSFADEARDTADQKVAMIMDKEDMLQMFDTQYMRNTIAKSLTAQYSEMTEEDLEAVLTEAKKLIENGEFAMTIEMYTLDEGATLIGMVLDMNMVMKETDSETVVTMAMNGGYNRLTDANGVSHKADLTIQADGEEMDVAFDLYKQKNGVSKGMLGMLVDGEEIVVTYLGEPAAHHARSRKFDLYLRSGANAILEPAASARPIIGFAIISEPAPDEVLSDLENATAENSVNVMNLSEDELNELGNVIATNGMQVFYTAMSQLPTSVLNLLMAE